jgi:hypothetical protein
MQLTFVQLVGFVREWRRFRLSDDDLRALEEQLMRQPEAGAVVAGTGGLRKIRFAPPSRHAGKSGMFRVAYVHLPGARAVVLMSMFAKSDQANLTASEKARFKAVIDALKLRR